MVGSAEYTGIVVPPPVTGPPTDGAGQPTTRTRIRTGAVVRDGFTATIIGEPHINDDRTAACPSNQPRNEPHPTEAPAQHHTATGATVSIIIIGGDEQLPERVLLAQLLVQHRIPLRCAETVRVQGLEELTNASSSAGEVPFTIIIKRRHPLSADVDARVSTCWVGEVPASEEDQPQHHCTRYRPQEAVDDAVPFRR